MSDLRYALRTLTRSPAFTLAAIVTLALGIGANTTIFTVVDAILLRPPAGVAHPERLVALYTSDYSGPRYGTSSYPDLEEFRRRTDLFADVVGYQPGRTIAIGEGDAAQRAGLEIVSQGYFSALGVRPALGRFFLPEESRAPGGPAVAVISHALWQQWFEGDPAVGGRVIQLNATPVTVVGVAPEGFTGLLRGIASEVWVPSVLAGRLGVGSDEELTQRGGRGLFVMARLQPGVTIARAQAGMNVLAGQLRGAYPDVWTDVHRVGRRVTLVEEKDARVPPQVRGPALGFVALLMATVGIVLLVCCANVAGLMLARASRRVREIGIRLSLGASRARIVRQMLTESTLLALAGGAVGVLVATWATAAIVSFQPPLPVKIALDVSPDARVFVFTAIIAIGTGIVFGLIPALRASRPDLVQVVKSDTPSVVFGKRRLSLQNALVGSQVAMSLLLLVVAMLFLRSLGEAANIDPGFRVDHLLIVSVTRPPAAGTRRPGASEENPGQPLLEMQRRIAGLPGVTSVSWASGVPLALDASRRGTTVEGYRPSRGEDMEFHFNTVGPRYFETMGIPLVRGRGFTDQDRAGAPGVVVVNEAFARRFWPNENPIGKRLSFRGPQGPFHEVVGIARDGHYLSLAEAARPYMFIPSLQMPDAASLHVRTAGPPRALAAAVRREIAAAAPDWAADGAHTAEEYVGTSLLPQRVAGAVLSLFGVVALLLASVGLYGVVAYATAQRTREIGIRVALGATREDVVRLVIRQGMSVVALGAGVGLLITAAVTRLVSSQLLGVGAMDPLSFLGATVLLAAVALVASYLPARTAARVDPMVALRTE